MNRRTRWIAAGSTAVGVVLAAAGVGLGIGTIAHAVPTPLRLATAPVLTNPSPSTFTSPKANPYFPLTPGLTERYRGTDGDQPLHEKLTVTHKTKTILGVQARVIRDVLRRADGSIAEATSDWYADDNAGNVWYFGEDTATFRPSGTVESREGSWQAGVRGAVAGVIMKADPKVTDAYRQEFWRGHAEDQAWTVQSNTTVKVGTHTYRHVLRSYEWSRLEKSVVSLKFYAPGVGIIRERDVAGGQELFNLVSVTRP